MKSLLELQDIYLNYKTENTLVEVIKGVNLKINSGENVAVVGKSGSGKTSLIMLIAGLEKATSGKIIFEDQDISTYSEDELADLSKFVRRSCFVLTVAALSPICGKKDFL